LQPIEKTIALRLPQVLFYNSDNWPAWAGPVGFARTGPINPAREGKCGALSVTFAAQYEADKASYETFQTQDVAFEGSSAANQVSDAAFQAQDVTSEASSKADKASSEASEAQDVAFEGSSAADEAPSEAFQPGKEALLPGKKKSKPRYCIASPS
jgi:hypothetical protein